MGYMQRHRDWGMFSKLFVCYIYYINTYIYTSMRNISENILQNKYLILKSVEENECYQNAFCSQQLIEMNRIVVL